MRVRSDAALNMAFVVLMQCLHKSLADLCAIDGHLGLLTIYEHHSSHLASSNKCKREAAVRKSELERASENE